MPITRTLAALALATSLGACGAVDTTLFSGDSTFADFNFGDGPKPKPSGLAEVEDPKVFLETAARIAESESNHETAAKHWAGLYAHDPKDRRVAGALARNLRYIGRTEDAERVLRQGLRDHPQDFDMSEELAKTMIASGRLREGATLLTQLAERPSVPAPRASRLRSAIGVAFDRAGKHGDAQRSYQLALQADPLNGIAMSNLGLSQALAGDLDAAERTLREALVAPNASSQVRQNLAMVLALKGESGAATRLARQDLPEGAASRLVGYYGSIGDQQDAWADAAAQ